MPLYVYKCPVCGKERSDVRSIADRHDGPLCGRPEHGSMQLQINAVPGFVRNPAVPRKS